MGLRSKWLDKKMNFEAFLEKITDYILRELKNPRDIVSVVRDLKDPTINFKWNNLPRNLTSQQLKSYVEVAIQREHIKMYVIRESDMSNNMDKICGLV